MRVLVTGGGGYLGTVLIQQVLTAGHVVRCLDGPGRHLPAALLQSGRATAAAETVVGDVRDDVLMQR
jgi:nucleoside-diphosphate-sugar epimerase